METGWRTLYFTSWIVQQAFEIPKVESVYRRQEFGILDNLSWFGRAPSLAGIGRNRWNLYFTLTRKTWVS
jgi:hypothetical protein